MQGTYRSLAVAAFVLFAVPVQALDVPMAGIDFAVPGAVSGDVAATSAVRLVLLFPAAQSRQSFVELSGLERPSVVNHTYQVAHADLGPTLGEASVPIVEDSTSETSGSWQDMQLSFSRLGAASLYIEADAIAFSTSGNASLETAPPPSGWWPMLPDTMDEDNPIRGRPGVDGESYLRFLTPGASLPNFTANATGLRVVEWANADVACDGPPCPDHGGRTRITRPGPAGTSAQVEALHYEELLTQGGTLRASGGLWFAIVGGASMDVDVLGSVRLPLARGAESCAQCARPDNETLHATGHLSLAGLHATGSRTIAGEFGGAITSSRIDEMPIVVPGLDGVAVTAGAAAVAGTVAVAIRLLLPLLTTPKEPLAHPRRARIHSYIQQHPGATFREVARGAAIPTGTTRHHLNILKRGKLIVEHQHRSTVRFFENHGRFDATWRREVLLREPELAQLAAWIERHPGAPQKDILEAMEAERECSRSTTQHRLVRLESEGIVQVRLQGRLKTYVLAAAPAKPHPRANPAPAPLPRLA